MSTSFWGSFTNDSSEKHDIDMKGPVVQIAIPQPSLAEVGTK